MNQFFNLSKVLIFIVFLFTANISFAQEGEDTVMVEKIVLKSGQPFTLKENQSLYVTYGADFTTLDILTKGSRKPISYEAKDIDTLIFRKGEKVEICKSYQVGKKDYLLLTELFGGEKASVYRTPHFGSGGFFYLKKSDQDQIELCSALRNSFIRNLSDCESFKEAYKAIKTNASLATEKNIISDDEAIEMTKKYNELCQ